jgi:hypothetical protein
MSALEFLGCVSSSGFGSHVEGVSQGAPKTNRIRLQWVTRLSQKPLMHSLSDGHSAVRIK